MQLSNQQPAIKLQEIFSNERYTVFSLTVDGRTSVQEKIACVADDSNYLSAYLSSFRLQLFATETGLSRCTLVGVVGYSTRSKARQVFEEYMKEFGYDPLEKCDCCGDQPYKESDPHHQLVTWEEIHLVFCKKPNKAK